MSKPLVDITAQEAFDTVAAHLLNQMDRAVSENGDCAYRGCGGLKCAVGVLIPDSIYDPKWEGDSCFGLIANYNVFDESLGWLLTRLQDVHDNYGPRLWAIRLREVADWCELVIPDFLKEADK